MIFSHFLAQIPLIFSHFLAKIQDMEREIEQELATWKDEEGRLPLLVRGARQVGKTYIIEQFGRVHFPRLAVINFEYQPEAKEAFDSLDPVQICARLEVYAKERIVPGETLLFLDEIQACPKAILAMRYFKEKMPELHLIGAGSLLEFVLHEEEFSFPVGRVQFLYLRPLSFREFLIAMGEERLASLLDSLPLGQSLGSGLH